MRFWIIVAFTLIAILQNEKAESRPLTQENSEKETSEDNHAVEDDIIFTEEQKLALGLIKDNGKKGRTLIGTGDYLWPGGVVPWTVDPQYPIDDSVLGEIRRAVVILERDTCLSLPELSTPPSDNSDHLLFGAQTGCWSYYGRAGHGGQQISLGYGCGQVGIIIHEIAHALALLHEHSRSDRDQYLKVNYGNINYGKESNFVKMQSVNIAPFDESSIMMYYPFAFSKNGFPTLKPFDRDLRKFFGSHTLSFYNLQTINTAYQCASHCPNTCQNDGFLLKDCSCSCPKGLGGPSCQDLDHSAYNCGSIVNLSAGQQITISSPNYPGTYPKPVDCAWVFLTQTGLYLEMEVDDLDLNTISDCDDSDDHLEVRYNLPGQEGLKYCTKPNRRFSTYHRMGTQMSVFLHVKSSQSNGFRASVKAKTPTGCSPYPCQNGGTCTDYGHPSYYQCQCPSGITGTLCETFVDAVIVANFENGLEPMKRLERYPLQWEMLSGETPSYGTGPTVAQSGNYYIYVEATGNSNKYCEISSPLIFANKAKILSFYYHMKGKSMGTLSVVRHFIDGSEETIWSVSGNQGSDWRRVQLALPAQSRDYYLHFLALTGYDFFSDIALDNIVIAPDHTNSHPTTSSTTTTTPSTTTTTAPPISTQSTTTTSASTTIPTSTSTSTTPTTTTTSTTTTTTTKSPSGTSSPYLTSFSVNFENGFGFLTNTRVFHWQTGSLGSPSYATGPSAAYEGYQYAFLEASDAPPDEVATLSSPLVDNTKENCLYFAYHMYGDGIGSLLVSTDYIHDGLFYQTGNKGNSWLHAKVVIPPQSKPYSIHFHAVRGKDYRGDVALDDIKFGPCDATLTTSTTRAPVQSLHQSFETGFAGFQLSGDANWKRHQFATASYQTGPTSANTGLYYIHLEASSPSYSGQKVVLTTTDQYDQKMCVSFYWHMYGVHIGELRVGVVDPSGNFNVEWSRNGDNGNKWVLAQFAVTKQNFPYKVRFEGVRGSGYKGDIALDDISIISGDC